MFGEDSGQWVAYILGAVLTLTVMGSFWGLSVQLVTFREQGILRRFRLAPVGAGPAARVEHLSNYFWCFRPSCSRFWFAASRSICNRGEICGRFSCWSRSVRPTFSSFGLIVASVTNTMQETQMINKLIWMGFLFLSGATVPLAIFPSWLQRVALLFPRTYLATGLESATTNLATMGEVLHGCRGAGDRILWMAFEISRQLFRWEPEAKVPSRAKFWVLAAFVPFLAFGTWENIAGNRLQQIRLNYLTVSGRVLRQVAPRR